MTPTFHIRKATAADAAAVSNIIMSLAHCFVTDPSSDADIPYFASVTPDAMLELIESSFREYLVGEIDGEVVALASLREYHHIGHLFVSAACQRQGIARKLWHELEEMAQANGNTDEITVNSSLYAIPFYEELGFEQVEDRIDKNGVSFVPMKYAFSQAH